MNLDESGIEALEQEAPIPPPITSEDTVPRAASPAATSTPALVEEKRAASRTSLEGVASPVTTKTRKPRGRRVSECRDEDRDVSETKDKDPKDKKDTAKAADKDEKLEEKKAVVVSTQNRSSATSYTCEFFFVSSSVLLKAQ